MFVAILCLLALADTPTTPPAVEHLPPRVLPIGPIGPIVPIVPRPHPAPEKPNGGDLRHGIIKVEIVLQPELLLLANDLHDDRALIVSGFVWALWLATAGVVLAGLATVRYVCNGWRSTRG